MSEMLERMAEAVKRHIHAEIEADVRASELTGDELRGIARAALLALREPTEGMHAKLDELLDTFIGADPDQRDVVGVFFVRAWRAAIDHALQTQEKGE